MVAPAISTKVTKFRKSAVLVVALTLLSVLCLCVVEFGLRVFDPIGLWYFAEAHKYFVSMQQNDEYAYIHTPGFHGRFQGVDVAINSSGFRGPEIESANSQNRIRVLVLGDSVVFGWGAPQNAIFPLKLQGMLELVVPEIEVIPAGVGSWNTRTEYEYLRSKGVHFGPRVIILLITANDLDPKRTGRTDIPKNFLFASDAVEEGAGRRFLSRLWKIAVRRSYLMAYVHYLRRRQNAARHESDANPESLRWEDAKLALDGIVQLSRNTGAILLPYLYGSTDTVEKNGVLRLYRDYLKTNSLGWFALPERLFTDRQLRNSVVDGHPNSNGHAIIAREMYEQVMLVLKSLKARKGAEQGAEDDALHRAP